jgi:hypothetical protein
MGIGCAIAAIPLYLYIPTIWSALISFLGSAAQAFMTLQLALILESSIYQGSKI